MFHRKTAGNQKQERKIEPLAFPYFFIETLEDRQLLSVSVAHHHNLHAHKTHGTATHAKKHHAASTSTASADASTTSDPTTFQYPGERIDSIAFDLTPTLVQSGLNALASTDGLTAPTSTQSVHLGNSNGVETYSLDYTTTGTQSRITVDQTGMPVTAPTQSTITWADLSGTGASGNAAATAEISSIATALSLTPPTDTTVVNVSTTASGSIYSVRLTDSSSTTSAAAIGFDPGRTVVVDSSGNPVGNQSVPFSTLPSAIQGYINANLPTGASALDASSTQTVRVRTIDGLVTYATDFTTTGTTSTVTVDLAGALITATAPTTATYSSIPAPAHDELQTLATAEGVTATIPDSQTVHVFTELNGTIIYSVTLSATDSTTTDTYNITIASDAMGDPTVPPGFGGFGGGGFGHGFAGGGFGGGGFAGGFGGGGGDCSGM